MFTLNYKHYCSLNQYFFWKCFWHIPNVCVILTQLLHTYITKTKIFGFNKSKNSWSSTEIQNMQKNCICYEITWPYNNGISLIANFVKIVMLHIQTFSGDFQHTCDKMHASIVLGMWWWAMCIFLFLKFYNFVILIHSILKRFRPLSLNLTHSLNFNRCDVSFFKQVIKYEKKCPKFLYTLYKVHFLNRFVLKKKLLTRCWSS